MVRKAKVRKTKVKSVSHYKRIVAIMTVTVLLLSIVIIIIVSCKLYLIINTTFL